MAVEQVKKYPIQDADLIRVLTDRQHAVTDELNALVQRLNDNAQRMEQLREWQRAVRYLLNATAGT